MEDEQNTQKMDVENDGLRKLSLLFDLINLIINRLGGRSTVTPKNLTLSFILDGFVRYFTETEHKC